MDSEPIYHFHKTRRQQSRLFFRMAGMCWFYMLCLFFYEFSIGEPVAEDFRLASYWGFSIASMILVMIGWWHLEKPGYFEAIVTHEQLKIHYPDSDNWSFQCRIDDIVRFEHRRKHDHAGKSPLRSGVVLEDGSFHHISMNYGNSLNDIYKAVKSVKPGVTFSSQVNTKYEGLGLDRDYKD